MPPDGELYLLYQAAFALGAAGIERFRDVKFAVLFIEMEMSC